MSYQEDDYLMLSGIQHFYFCKRQWALIHIEQQWSENAYTAHGNILHEKADKPLLKEKRGDTFISRAMPVSSKELGLSGILDVVEFRKNEKGVVIPGKKGKWQPAIIEYKSGKKKPDDRDNIQLAAQTMCLEEEYKISIPTAFLYYFKTNEKVEVQIDAFLREQVKEMANLMHQMYQNKETGKAEYFKNCQLCSLYDVCMPRLTKKQRSVNNYIYGESI